MPGLMPERGVLDIEHVICLCPASRLSVSSLVLSTWSAMQRCSFVELEPNEHVLSDATAIVVMDRFVSRILVQRLLARRPVIVIAWNGLFEIERYRQQLRDLDVVYMGPEEALDVGLSYRPMIRQDCEYAVWRSNYADKQQFSAAGSIGYRARWRRVQLMGRRLISVAVAAAAATRRPRALRRTLESAVLSDRLVWAGVCYVDATVGLSTEEQAALSAGLERVKCNQSAESRMHHGLALVAEWRARSTPQNAHRVLYVTNTLLRWTVISFLLDTAKPQTWFFGKDNLGLGLELELYVHNLVPTERIAFLELGGTKTGDGIYPRALHLLSREFYVISIPADGSGDLASVLERLRANLAEPRRFFDFLESRRRQLYAELSPGLTLASAHHRVWDDFSASQSGAR